MHRLWMIYVVTVTAALVATCQRISAAPPPNDNFAGAQLIEGLQGGLDGDSTGATNEINEPGTTSGCGMYSSVWYRWAAPDNVAMNFAAHVPTSRPHLDPALAIYTGSSLGDLSLLVTNDDISPGYIHGPSRVSFLASVGTTYYIQLASGCGTVDGYPVGGYFSLTWTYAGSGPTNDNFADATLIDGDAGMTQGTNQGATVEVGEPNNTPSVWYRWIAPRSSPVTFSTDGSNYDTVLQIYTGASVGSSTFVAGNDDISYPHPSNLNSLVRFNAVQGQEYRITVYGVADLQGQFYLNWSGQPANDNFTDAQWIQGMSGTAHGNNVAATFESAEPNPVSPDEPRNRTVWFAWPAPDTAPISFSVAAADATFAPWAPQFSVFTGDSLDTLQPLVKNSASVAFQAEPGTTYYIQVDGYFLSGGSFDLSWSPPPTPTPTITDTPTMTSTPTDTPTFPPSATATSSTTGTRTSTRTTTPTATPSETPPTPPTPFCAGDCNGDREVTINEIILMVNIALGSADNSACLHGIPAPATVDISLIIQAVNNVLSGCPGT